MLEIEKRKDAIVLTMAFVALVVIVFLNISYQLIFVLFTILSIYVFVSYLIIWKDIKGERLPPEIDSYPSVSVIIPSYNARETIFRSIEACKEMAREYPGKCEIIVADDGSTDGSYEQLCELSGIRVLRKERNTGKAAVLNFGVENSKGEIVACVDSDTYPQPDALLRSVKHFYARNKVAAVSIFVCVQKPKNLLQSIQEIEYWISFGFFFKTIATVNGLYVTPGPMALYRKDILQKLGGFDEHNLTEDMEIALRMQREGYRIAACHETKALTEVPSELPRLFRQRMRWYRGGVMNVLKYSDMFFNPRYGDFGLFVLPTTLGSGFFAAIFMIWTIMNLAKQSLSWASPFFANFSASLSATVGTFGSQLFAFNSTWVFGLMALAIWSYFLVKSFEISREKMRVRHFLPLFCLLWVYPLFIGFVFLLSYLFEFTGRDYRW